MSEINPQRARAIGEKLRAIRQQRQMSLRELADKADVSASMLSQIETGKAYPSVRSLYNIADALTVPVDYFFPEKANNNAPSFESDSTVVRTMTASEMREANVQRAPTAIESVIRTLSPTPVVHANSRPTIELKGGVTWSRLTMLAEAGAEFLEITYAPGATSGANMSHHEGREFGLVLEGELVVELGFDTYTLRSGDSIIFDSTTPHRLTNQDAQPMRALWVVLSGT
jgi:transcriptional regulator with XRE-family HTH domain/quercetin dioxygenase-like cupin family protein